MSSARGPDSASGGRAWHDIRAPCLASLAGPHHPCGQLRRRRATGVQSLSPGILPSGLGMVRPPPGKREIRLKSYMGASTPAWVTSAGSAEGLVTGARNALAMSAQCHECGSCHEVIEQALFPRCMSPKMARMRRTRTLGVTFAPKGRPGTVERCPNRRK